MAINWLEIRPFNGSQNNAFEELVCQLARDEEFENQAEFYRIAAPDGGVEAYCVFDNGEEYGWQAKYFSSMKNAQWSQLTESFKTALRTHPNLTRYYVCIPLDRQDPRKENQEWFMDRWNQKIQEWTDYALSEGRKIEFEYWGSSELVHRLSQDKNAGRTKFWFSTAEFSNEWFADQVKRSVANLGKRYTPELNVKIDITEHFDAVSRNTEFKDRTKILVEEFSDATDKLASKLSSYDIVEEISSILVGAEKISTELLQLQKAEMFFVNPNSLRKLTGEMYCLYEKIEHHESISNISSKDTKRSVRDTIGFAYQCTSNIESFVNSSLFLGAVSQTLLLTGKAGIGKSHSLADIALQRINENRSCIFLLGQHFTSDTAPWTQILDDQLRLNCSADEFLGALDAMAQSQGERVLIVIDAINEGRGKYFWPDHLSGFISDVGKYPWVGLILSIRSTYVPVFDIDSILEKHNIAKVVHAGFSGIEYEATSFFFSQFNIELPSVPFLNPEFSNPLFLKLFCEGLEKAGLSKIPKGYEGISSVLDFLIKNANDRLSKPNELDYPSNINLVKRAIDAIVSHQIDNGLTHVSYEDAYLLADNILQQFSNKRGFLEKLISEDVFTKNMMWVDGDKYEEMVFMSYERFDDHYTASYLLDNVISSDSLDSVFRKDGSLFHYLKESYFYQGIIESLSIQVPERTSKELFDLVDVDFKEDITVVSAFIYSLLWRSKDTISDKTKTYINEVVLRNEQSFDEFFEAVYTIALEPDHPYNAISLHDYLKQYGLAERDAIWTTYLHDKDSTITSMMRLTDWAYSQKSSSNISDESKRLASIAISWMFGTTNLSLRDKATKALSRLLENSGAVSISLLEDFKDVDDPYVFERVLASIYGALLRSHNLEEIDHICENLINTIFSCEEVYPNVLVRDYARNIIEYALSVGMYSLPDVQVIRPPYRSSFPETFPSNEEVDAYKFDYDDKDFKDYYWGQNSILSSMVTEYGRGVGSYGDFGRYEFQSAVSNWDAHDSNDLSNYACILIFEKYGYDVEMHGRFDRNANDGSRQENKKERIGKKYQWLAMYEVLARLADNFEMRDDSTGWGSEQEYMWFQGPWEPFVRNIDPTLIQPSTDSSLPKINQQCAYSHWDGTNEDWLVDGEVLPVFEKLIQVSDSNKNEWIALESHPSWDDPKRADGSRSSKHLWYQIRSYIAEKESAPELINFLETQSFMGRWMPESPTRYQVFGLEYYWSPAYQFFEHPYYGDTDWEEVRDRDSDGKIIGKLQVTTDSYNWESGASSEKKYRFLCPSKFIFNEMGLRFSKFPGLWLDQENNAACFSLQTDHVDSLELYVRKDILQQFLEENNLSLIWTCLGEKRLNSKSFSTPEFKRWLEVSGVYTFNDDGVVGSVRPITRKINSL